MERGRRPLLLVGVAVGLTAALAPVPVAAFQDAPEDRRVVAVLRFGNNTGDARFDHLGRALSSTTISALSVIERTQLVERERLEELLAELDLQQSADADPSPPRASG